jgi:hypothetical protein
MSSASSARGDERSQFRPTFWNGKSGIALPAKNQGDSSLPESNSAPARTPNFLAASMPVFSKFTGIEIDVPGESIRELANFSITLRVRNSSPLRLRSLAEFSVTEMNPST